MSQQEEKTTADRRCNECDECCTVLAVKEIGKPVDTPCQYLVAPSGGGCCGIYDSQPAPCRKFKCAWLFGLFPESFRPDRIGIVVYPANSEVGKGILLAETREGALESVPGKRIAAQVEQAGKLVMKREVAPRTLPGASA